MIDPLKSYGLNVNAGSGEAAKPMLAALIVLLPLRKLTPPEEYVLTPGLPMTRLVVEVIAKRTVVDAGITYVKPLKTGTTAKPLDVIVEEVMLVHPAPGMVVAPLSDVVDAYSVAVPPLLLAWT